MTRELRQLLGLLAVSALIFFVSLGVPRLWDEDEPIFAGAALEMFERGEWCVPYFNGVVLPDKPVLMYWVMMAGYAVFGPTEFAARCGSAAFGLGSVLLTWLLARRLFSVRVAFWAGLALATSLNFDVIARAATPDSLLVFFSTLALYAFVCGASPRAAAGTLGANIARAPLTRSPSWGAYAAMYGAMGFAALAKGPIGIALPTASIGMYMLIVRRRSDVVVASGDPRSWRSRCGVALRAIGQTVAPRHFFATAWSMRPLTAAAAILAVAGPWYAWVGLRTDGAWLEGFFGVHNFGRFLNAMEHHRGPFFYYLIAVCIGFFPWTVFLTPAARLLIRRTGSRHRWSRSYLLLSCWVGVYLVFFSLAKTKLPNYIVPIYPALALLTGAWLDFWLRRPGLVIRRDLRAAWITLTLIGLGISVGLPIAAGKFLGGDWTLGLAGLPLVLGALAAWRLAERGPPHRAAIALAASCIVFCATLFGWGAVRVDRRQNSAEFATTIREHASGAVPVIRSFGYYRPSLVFYSRQPVRQFTTPEQVGEFFRSQPQDAFLFTSDARYRQLAGVLPADVKVLDDRPWFLRNSRILLLGRENRPQDSGAPVASVFPGITASTSGATRRN